MLCLWLCRVAVARRRVPPLSKPCGLSPCITVTVTVTVTVAVIVIVTVTSASTYSIHLDTNIVRREATPRKGF